MNEKSSIPSTGAGSDRLKEKARAAYGGNITTGISNLDTTAPLDSQSLYSESPVNPVAPPTESPEERAPGTRHTGMPGEPEPITREPRPGSELGKARG